MFTALRKKVFQVCNFLQFDKVTVVHCFWLRSGIEEVLSCLFCLLLLGGRKPVRRVYPFAVKPEMLSHCACSFGKGPLLPYLLFFSSILSSAVPIPSHQFQGLMVSRFLSPHHYKIVSQYVSSHCMSSLLDFWALLVLWPRLYEQWYTWVNVVLWRS